jgi:hypothetical protein
MYLKQSRYKNGRVYLSIVESYRKDGKSRTATVEKCGYLDELKKDREDPVAYFSARAAELTARKQAEDAPIALEFHPKEKIDIRKTGAKNIGHAVLSQYYHLLRIDEFWDNRRMRGGFDYDPNAIFKLLSYMRVISPGSKAKAYREKDSLVDRMDFSENDMYRCLPFFARYERDLVEWIKRFIRAGRKRNTACAYYDVTNYYFEIDAEDDFRRRGVCKEHRPNPIVQMGLMMDLDGIPLDYALYEGSTNDCTTLLPALKALKDRHDTGHVIVVADKGLNTSDNIAANILDNNGFIFSQSVRRATKELKAWVLDCTGYSGGNDFKIKERQATKHITVAGEDNKRRKVAVEVKEVAFWSRDYAKRAKAERACVIEKSAAAIARGDLAAAKAHSSVRYVKDTPVVTQTGEAASHAYSLDTDKIAKDEKMDGYYCIVTNEVDMPAADIIEAYRGLWRIEETFKVTKSTLEARPVYVSRFECIHAHFLICYMALVLLRLIQADLGWRYSADALQEALSSMTGLLMQKNYYLFGYRTQLTDELGALCGIDLSRKVLSTGQMKKILSDTKKV